MNCKRGKRLLAKIRGDHVKRQIHKPPLARVKKIQTLGGKSREVPRGGKGKTQQRNDPKKRGNRWKKKWVRLLRTPKNGGKTRLNDQELKGNKGGKRSMTGGGRKKETGTTREQGSTEVREGYTELKCVC